MPLSPLTTGPRRLRDSAFTLIEVMIAVAVLTVGMFSVLSMIPTLSGTRKLALEMVLARQIAESLAERVQGAAWSDLGGNVTTITNENAWSLPRYYNSSLPKNPPLTEDTAIGQDNVQTVGILTQRSGMANLKIYLEYYTGDIMKTANDRTAFMNAISGTAGLANRRDQFNSTNQDGVAIVRILLTWNEPIAGRPMNRHELFVARRN